MKTVYSCTFELAAANGNNAETVFTTATQMVRQWVEGKYQRPLEERGWATLITLPETGRVTPISGHSVTIDRQAADGSSMFSLTWEHPDDKDSNSMWSSQVLLARDDRSVNFALQTRLASLRYVIQPLSYVFGTPGIVRDFLGAFSCSIQGWSLPLVETVLKVDDVDHFVTERLLAAARPIPVVVISPTVWSERTVVSPADWIRACAGFAEVAVLANKWAAFRLTEALGKELSCYDGAVRIYWPGLQTNSSPREHGLWLAAYLRLRANNGSPVERGLFKLLSAIAVTRHIESPIVNRIRRALDSASHAEREAAVAAVKSHQLAKADLENQLLDAWDKNEKLRQELESTRSELEAQRESWAQMQSYLTPQDAAELPPEATASETAPEFASILEAYDAAAKEFGGNDSAVYFLETARKSAGDSPYNSPDQVYALLKELHTLAGRWRAGNGRLGQTWEEALAPTGFEYKAHISQTTETKYGNDYKFLYEGRKLLFQEHVTKGAKHAHTCFSVHLYRDEKKFRLVIGHCGKHLPNTTT